MVQRYLLAGSEGDHRYKTKSIHFPYSSGSHSLYIQPKPLSTLSTLVISLYIRSPNLIILPFLYLPVRKTRKV